MRSSGSRRPLPMRRRDFDPLRHRMIGRRTWLTGALSLAAAPLATGAQAPPSSARIGLLGSHGPASAESRHVWKGFLEGLRDLGWVEGQNIVVEGRYYGDRLDQLPALAAELVRLPVDVIVTGAPPAPEAAKRATSTIPIVMALHSDPVAGGLVASLSRPGGNITGLSMLSREMRVKQLELLKEIVPRLTRVAFLRHPDVPLDMKDLAANARALGLVTHVVEARAPNEIATAFSAAARQQAGAVSVLAGTLFYNHRAPVAELAIKSRLPTVYMVREHAEAGGLLTYGIDVRDNYRRAAGIVDRVLRGARPGDLPIEQPTKFDLAINLKTAKALGLTIPRSVLARANLIIE